MILRKSTKKDLVTKHLDIIFSSVKHTDQTEREVGIALGDYIVYMHNSGSHFPPLIYTCVQIDLMDLHMKRVELVMTGFYSL